MKLLLPLKYYDDAGRVKPPVGLYLTALYLCRSIVVLIGAYSSKQYSNELISLFYGEQRYLYLSLMIALPALLSVTLIGFREKLWKTNKVWMFFWVKPLLIISSLADLGSHVFFAHLQHWQFSWIIAFTLLIDIFCLYYLSRDKHISFMLQDWRKAENHLAPVT